MEDSIYYGLVALDFVKHRVRKSSHECTAVALVDERIHQGISLDCKECCLQTAKKLHAKTKGLIRRYRQHPAWPQEAKEGHQSSDFRMDFFTSDQGKAESGFCKYFSFRCVNSSFCHFGMGMSVLLLAMLSQRSSTIWSLSGTESVSIPCNVVMISISHMAANSSRSFYHSPLHRM